MEFDVVTGERVKILFEGGLASLAAHRQEIDRLNVFPVPDGDTGRNMYLTLVAAVKEMEGVNSREVGNICGALAKGSLMGARGNSGVILSQLIRGLAEAVKGKETITVSELARAWQVATAVAYRAVVKPVEGTMLTVARGFTRGIAEAAQTEKDLREVLNHAIREGNETLRKTPEMLPVLKKAGVVDAGGKGLMVILEGGLTALRDGKESHIPPDGSIINSENSLQKEVFQEEGDFSYLYCISLLLQADVSLTDQIRKGLHPMGASLVIGGAGDLIKLHLHTNSPGKVLEYCHRYGTLHNIEIFNMRDQWEEAHGNLPEIKDNEDPAADLAELGFVAVVAGDGLKMLFEKLGVSEIIEGGQTMNPPVEEFVRAIEKVPSPEVIVLPNNKNLILAAEQAGKLVKKVVEIVPSTSIPAGIAAVLAFNDTLSLAENKEKMCQNLAQVKVGEVTYAVRDAAVNEIDIKEGEYLGLYDGGIAATGASLDEVLLTLISRIATGGEEIITLYAGAGITPGEAERIARKVREAYPELEVETYDGGQPVYFYLVSVE